MPSLPSDWFDQIKAEYPKRQGTQGWYGDPFLKIIKKRLSEGHTFDVMIEGARAYKGHCDYTGIAGSGFVMQAQRFFGPSCYFKELESYEIPTTSYTHRQPEVDTETAEEKDLKFKRDLRERFKVV